MAASSLLLEILIPLVKWRLPGLLQEGHASAEEVALAETVLGALSGSGKLDLKAILFSLLEAELPALVSSGRVTQAEADVAKGAIDTYAGGGKLDLGSLLSGAAQAAILAGAASNDIPQDEAQAGISILGALFNAATHRHNTLAPEAPEVNS